MSFARLSESEAAELLAASHDPAFTAMNRFEAQLAEELSGKSPYENFEQLIVWLRLLAQLTGPLEPNRELPISRISLL